MNFSLPEPGLLLLEDGSVFRGYAAGLPHTSAGEICFNTSMYGYQESFTDPSYAGQILVSTTPHIGNYGCHPDEAESATVHIRALVCNQFSQKFSRLKPHSISLESLLSNAGVPILFGVDTRQLVRQIRNGGVLRGIVSTGAQTQNPQHLEELRNRLAQIPPMKGQALAAEIGVQNPLQFGNINAPFHIVVIDFGMKQGILRCLLERNARVTCMPAHASTSEILALKPDGILISNGPGDPEPLSKPIQTVRELLQSGRPIMGICLGHQLLGHALGLRTYKMKHGHRGVNHPILNLLTNRCEITSQNHGFAILRNDFQHLPNAEITHIHLNDDTVAGFRLKNKPVFSVQYHPEASPGPEDSRYLFDQFFNMMIHHRAN